MLQVSSGTVCGGSLLLSRKFFQSMMQFFRANPWAHAGWGAICNVGLSFPAVRPFFSTEKRELQQAWLVTDDLPWEHSLLCLVLLVPTEKSEKILSPIPEASLPLAALQVLALLLHPDSNPFLSIVGDQPGFFVSQPFLPNWTYSGSILPERFPSPMSHSVPFTVSGPGNSPLLFIDC